MDCKKIERQLIKEYARELCVHQISVHQARQTRMDTKIQRYFNSSQTRNAFARVVCLAALDDKPVSRSEIAQTLHISRQAASDMVGDCLASEWITETPERGLYASPILIDALIHYTEEHVAVMSPDLTQKYENLVKFREILSSQLSSTPGLLLDSNEDEERT